MPSEFSSEFQLTTPNKKLMPRNKEEFLVIGVWCVRGGVGH
jgi:hypothetical protein